MFKKKVKIFDKSNATFQAGKIFENYGSVPECIQAYNPDKPESPAITRRYRATYNPSAGEMTVHYGKSGDKEEDISRKMTHGIKSNVNPATVSTIVLEHFTILH